jgi:hypothetical protein
MLVSFPVCAVEEGCQRGVNLSSSTIFLFGLVFVHTVLVRVLPAFLFGLVFVQTKAKILLAPHLRDRRAAVIFRHVMPSLWK